MPTAPLRPAPRGRTSLAIVALLPLLLAATTGCAGGGGAASSGAAPTSSPATSSAAAAPSTASGSGEASTGPSASRPTSPRPSVPQAQSAPTTAAATRALAVYYVHDTDTGPKLYREFHRVPASRAGARGAVDAMIRVRAADPDYTSLWPRATRVLGTSLRGDTATVNLSREATRGSAGASFEAISLQQLVYTVTAAVPAAKRVRLLVEGRPVESLWGHVGVGTKPMTRAPQVDVLAPVWLEAPAQGATAGRTVRLRGQATVFEATVSWEVRRGRTLVKRGFTNATVGAPGRGTWSASVTLPPGSYLARAFASSPKDGRPTFVDDKAFRVR